MKRLAAATFLVPLGTCQRMLMERYPRHAGSTCLGPAADVALRTLSTCKQGRMGQKLDWKTLCSPTNQGAYPAGAGGAIQWQPRRRVVLTWLGPYIRDMVLQRRLREPSAGQDGIQGQRETKAGQ